MLPHLCVVLRFCLNVGHMHGCENGRGLGREQYVFFSLAAGQLVAILMRQYCRLSSVSPVSCLLSPVACRVRVHLAVPVFVCDIWVIDE